MTRQTDTTDGRTDAEPTDAEPTDAEPTDSDSAGAERASDLDGSLSSLADPETLRDRSDVGYSKRERVLPAQKFDALRDRYQAIAGVVQVGLTDDDRGVLLAGDDTYAPLGGNVAPGDDWVGAAERAIIELTGTEARVDDAVLFERTTFKREGDNDAAFDADSVLFAASVVDPDPALGEDPQFPDDLEHPLYSDTDTTLAWVEDVTDVAENHVDHVRAFLD